VLKSKHSFSAQQQLQAGIVMISPDLKQTTENARNFAVSSKLRLGCPKQQRDVAQYALPWHVAVVNVGVAQQRPCH
jgi:hypothetical protein